MIVVQSTKTRIFRDIPKKFIPRDSFPRDFGNMRIHILGLGLDGKFWPIIPHTDVGLNKSPSDLFMARHCATEVEEVYGMSTPWSEKVKLGIFAGIIVALLIVIFLLVTTATGGA